MTKTNEYTNLYDWCDNRLGQTLDNRHRNMWEEAVKLILTLQVVRGYRGFKLSSELSIF